MATWYEDDSLENTDAGKDWRQEEKGTTEDEMIEWHHRLDEHESVQALGVGDGQETIFLLEQTQKWTDTATHPCGHFILTWQVMKIVAVEWREYYNSNNHLYAFSKEELELRGVSGPQ